jgi:hypothetical protein
MPRDHGGESKYICGCGLSNTQPFCNGNHKITRGEDFDKLYWYDEQGIASKPLTLSKVFAVHKSETVSHDLLRNFEGDARLYGALPNGIEAQLRSTNGR